MNDTPFIRLTDAQRLRFDRRPPDRPSFADPRFQATAAVRTVTLLLLLAAVAALARFQTFGNPVLEYDEQFYRFVGERMVDGLLPYVDIWDRKPIGLFLIYAAAAGLWGKTAFAYQAMALLFVVATAWLMHGMAAQLSRTRHTPLVVAILYILWLDLLEGAGGQSPVLYMLPVCAAASLVLRSFDPRTDARTLMLRGTGIALLIGLAVQIKYTVVLEGGFFLLAMLWLLRRAGLDYARLATGAVGWGLVLLAPTLLAGLVYVGLGHGRQWWFANFESVLLRTRLPTDLSDLGGALAAIVPLALVAGWSLSRLTRLRTPTRFVIGWAIVAFLAILALKSFLPHYWMPLAPPLLLLCVTALDRARALAAAMIAAAAIAGQVVLAHAIWLHGDQRNLDNMIAAMGPERPCIFVFEGFPALNGVSSCMLTRFTFPGHLNAGWEAGALGVDAAAETRRIMRLRPQYVVRTDPAWQYGNQGSAIVLTAALRRDYRIIHVERTGRRWLKVIYKLKNRPAASPGKPASRQSPGAT